MLKISSSGTSNPGKKNINEDNFYMNGKFIAENNAVSGRIYGDDPPARGVSFYAVFDGLGEDIKSDLNPNINFYEGETAAFAAADMLSRLQRHIKTKEKYNLNEYISRFARKTNKNICDYINQKGGYKIGASFAILCFEGNSAYAYNIGNSKIYLLRDNRLNLVSRNDTKAESLVMAKQISADIVRHTQDNKILTQYLGVNENERQLDLHINRIPLKNGDKFLLCTDGLCEYLTPDRIYQTLSKDISEQEIVTELINESMRKEGSDNLTVIVAGVNYADESSSKANLLKPVSDDMPTHFAPLEFRNKFNFTPKHIKYIMYGIGALVLFVIAIVLIFNAFSSKDPDGENEPAQSSTTTENPGNTGNIVITTSGNIFDIDPTPAIPEDPTEEDTSEEVTTAAPTTETPAVNTTAAPTNPPETTAAAAQETTEPPIDETTTAASPTTSPTVAEEITFLPTELYTVAPETTEPVTEPPVPVTDPPTEPVSPASPENEPETIPPLTNPPEETIAAD